jgi:hypothetical protein
MAHDDAQCVVMFRLVLSANTQPNSESLPKVAAAACGHMFDAVTVARPERVV